MFKLCVKFDQNRTTSCRVIDDLAYYRREIFEEVAFTRKDLRGESTELHQTGDDIRPSRMVTEFVSELRYLASFLNAAFSKLSDVENEAKFRTF